MTEPDKLQLCLCVYWQTHMPTGFSNVIFHHWDIEEAFINFVCVVRWTYSLITIHPFDSKIIDYRGAYKGHACSLWLLTWILISTLTERFCITMEAKFVESGIVPDVIDIAPKQKAEVEFLFWKKYAFTWTGAMEYSWKLYRHFREHSYTHNGKLVLYFRKILNSDSWSILVWESYHPIEPQIILYALYIHMQSIYYQVWYLWYHMGRVDTPILAGNT